MNNPAISVRGLTHRYGGLEVIADLDFDIPPSSVVAILGPTGSGKSTLLKILAGLMPPAQGVVRVLDGSPAATSRQCSYMPQGDALLPWRRAIDNALLGVSIDERPTSGSRRRAGDLFARFGLQGFERSWPRELSGGMRQRVALIRTLLADRPVLLLDEPFGALDPATRTDLRAWMSDHLAASGKTALIVTHDVDEALVMADDILVMSSRPGSIVEHIHQDRGAMSSETVHVVKRQLLDAIAGGRSR